MYTYNEYNCNNNDNIIFIIVLCFNINDNIKLSAIYSHKNLSKSKFRQCMIV